MSFPLLFAILLFALFISVLTISYFAVLFQLFRRRDVFERSYDMFAVITLSIFLHITSHLSEIYLRGELIPATLDALAFIVFGVAMFRARWFVYDIRIALGVQEVLQAELDKRTKELKRSNELKETFIDILGHDLLNYITAIKNIALFLAEDESLKRIEEDIRMLRESSAKMEQMVQNATRLAKLESIDAIDKEEIDLTSTIENAVKLLKAQADAKGIAIVNNVRDPCPTKANKFIEDVFVNLISNSIKFSPNNSKVYVDKVEDNGYYKFAVKDNGEGIPDEYKTLIFSRFERRTKTGVKGTGLGLTIVKKILELHGGEVWVEDNKPNGSIFYAKIPKG